MAEIIGINGKKQASNTNEPPKIEVPIYELEMSDGDLITHTGFLSIGDGFLAVTDDRGYPMHIYSNDLWDEVHRVGTAEASEDFNKPTV